ncbi:mitochondrial outer membrane protein (Sam35), putative [Trichophyton verrucosum HKI 0517]|uniref:Mitochondrial outer membrane protein (Sam35), putative n=1 Tax=Trichophyton verrucosum (strain HKI 0517) TaxID=663202 RepID=D4DG58_TRIVH|nr:mitochondrial outer membrane protein (Sam35), putative [Trichophyton verrucosum HKI 0517]EFE39159.1 mitochondrial outer membrane protein (Sam35), putative [Trichophyton verrucosum HKI 0517]
MERKKKKKGDVKKKRTKTAARDAGTDDEEDDDGNDGDDDEDEDDEEDKHELMPAKTDSAMKTAEEGPKSWLPAIPKPVKRLFDQFPLVTYPPNTAPASSSSTAGPASSTGTDTNVGANERPGEHRLYIFTSADAARNGRPSVNPQCLMWQVSNPSSSGARSLLSVAFDRLPDLHFADKVEQAYLRFRGIEFRTVPSNNHASPDGALPFLLPAGPGGDSEPSCVAPSKLQNWADTNAKHQYTEAKISGVLRTYKSLLERNIRDAWLYTVYLDSSNFESIAKKAYVNPSTTNPLVRATLAYQLKEAAKDQLQRKETYIDPDDILAEAKQAFKSLSSLLGDNDYFTYDSTPCWFDAAVFSYTHLILDKTLGWKFNPLASYLEEHPNLVQHRQRLLDKYF